MRCISYKYTALFIVCQFISLPFAYSQQNAYGHNNEIIIGNTFNRLVLTETVGNSNDEELRNLSWGCGAAITLNRNIYSINTTTTLALGLSYNRRLISSKKYTGLRSVVPEAIEFQDRYSIHSLGPILSLYKYFSSRQKVNHRLSFDLSLPVNFSYYHIRKAFVSNNQVTRIIDSKTSFEIPLINIDVGVRYSLLRLSWLNNRLVPSIKFGLHGIQIITDGDPIRHANLSGGASGMLIYGEVSIHYFLL